MFHLFLFLSMFTAKQIHCMFHLFLFLSMFTAKQIYCMIYLFLFLSVLTAKQIHCIFYLFPCFSKVHFLGFSVQLFFFSLDSLFVLKSIKEI